MVDYALLAQFAWQGLQAAGSVLCTKIWEKLTDNVSEQAVTKFQNMLENKQEDEFKQELEKALEKNKALTEQLQKLQQTPHNTTISVRVSGNVEAKGEGIIINFGVMN